MTKYKVRFFQDNTYEVIALIWEDYDPDYPCEQNHNSEEKVFQGTLPECEAFIRLKEGGYL